MAPNKKVQYNIDVQTKNAAGIKVLTRQLKGFDKNLKSTARTSKLASRDLGSLRRGFQSFVAVLGIREITRAADKIQLLKDRVKIFSKDGKEAAETFKGISDIAKRTKTSVDSIGTSFNRLALSTKELGLSNEQILKTTEALQNTFRLSGSTIAEATSSTIQLSQGLSAGALRGQELRSVLEANAVLAGKLAKEFGVARGDLIKLAETGAITSQKVFKVLLGDFKNLSKEASKLKTTFGQSMTIVFDRLAIKLDEINDKFSLSQNFEKFTTKFLDNLDDIAITVGALVTGGLIVGLAGQINTLAIALKGLASSKTLLALTSLFGKGGLLLVAAALPSVTEGFDKVSDNIDRIKKLNKKLEVLKDERAKSSARQFQENKTVAQAKIGNTRLTKAIREVKEEIKALTSFNKKLGVSVEKTTEKINKFTAVLELKSIKELNELIGDGAIDLEEYANGVAKLGIEKLHKDFNTGKIEVDKYNESLRELNNTLQSNNQITEGVGRGINDYIKSAGTLADGIAAATSKVFSGLEDQLVKFVESGKIEFKSLANSILADLLRIAIRQAIVLPLANAAFGGLGSGGAHSSTTPGSAANIDARADGGAVSSGNILPFANGGVVSQPTFFPMKGSKTGLMGESGEEGILPLSRINGKLGVNAEGFGSTTIVNVINNSDKDVQTEESEGSNGEKQIDIMIGSKVNGLIAQGNFDRTLNKSFGLRRKGS